MTNQINQTNQIDQVKQMDAGDAGEKMLREIMDDSRLNYEVVGFLDDDAKKKGMRIHGVPAPGVC